uniref:Uncharacterized protein n=1 Tax=Tetranychus urticae TaxID=32264 RepID=T1KJN8_TETUR
MGILICPPLCLANESSGLSATCTKDDDCKFLVELNYSCFKPNGSDPGYCAPSAAFHSTI